MNRNKIKKIWFEWYILIVFILFLLICILINNYTISPIFDSIMIPMIGISLSTIYFVQKQKLEEIRLFKELFIEFNNRYNSLNDKISNIKNNEIKETKDIGKILDDYFNLCAEEYLFYKEGRIHDAVWSYWCNGILEHLKNDIIRNYWEKSIVENSYYGLTLKKIEDGSSKI